MIEFQAIPAWFGIAMLVITLFRLYRREMAVRAYHVQRGIDREHQGGGALEGRDGWTAPMAAGSDTWGYQFHDGKGLFAPTRCWWIKEALILFLTGRKREPAESHVIHVRRGTSDRRQRGRERGKPATP